MNPSRSQLFRACAALVWSIAAAAAQAGEVTLYHERDFLGEQVTLRGPTSDVFRQFREEVSSAVVHAGRWELCTGPGFRGDCVVLDPGQYVDLPSRLNRRVGSAREVGGYPQQRTEPYREPQRTEPYREPQRTEPYREPQRSEPYREPQRSEPYREQRTQPQGRPDIELFSDPGFGGDRFPANRNVVNLGPTDFNDRAESVIVYAGRWELCSDADYRGRCAVFGPGRYAELGELSRRVSSLRRVR